MGVLTDGVWCLVLEEGCICRCVTDEVDCCPQPTGFVTRLSTWFVEVVCRRANDSAVNDEDVKDVRFDIPEEQFVEVPCDILLRSSYGFEEERRFDCSTRLLDEFLCPSEAFPFDGSKRAEFCQSMSSSKSMSSSSPHDESIFDFFSTRLPALVHSLDGLLFPEGKRSFLLFTIGCWLLLGREDATWKNEFEH